MNDEESDIPAQQRKRLSVQSLGHPFSAVPQRVDVLKVFFSFSPGDQGLAPRRDSLVQMTVM